MLPDYRLPTYDSLLAIISRTTKLPAATILYLKRVFTELPKAISVEDIEALLPIRPVIDLEQVV